MEWFTEGKSIEKASRLEKKLRRMARKLNKISKKHGFTYLDVYFLHGLKGTESINIRAKKKDEVIFDSYAFIE